MWNMYQVKTAQKKCVIQTAWPLEQGVKKDIQTNRNNEFTQEDNEILPYTFDIKTASKCACLQVLHVQLWNPIAF